MRVTWLGCLCVLASVLLWAGCGKKEQPAPATQKQTSAVQEATKPQAPGTKEEVLAAIGKRIDQLETQLRELGQAAQEKGQQAKAEYEKVKPEIERKLDVLKKDLDSARTSAGEVWEGMKVKLGQGIESLEKEFSKATSKVEEKPEQPKPE